MKEQLIIVNDTPAFDDLTEVQVTITPHVMTFKGKDIGGTVISVELWPLQALRMTDSDCYSFLDDSEIKLNRIAVVENSRWLEELRAALKIADVDSTYLDGSRHFFLANEDMIIEMVAREWRVTDKGIP
jgi:hypothetical protein